MRSKWSKTTTESADLLSLVTTCRETQSTANRTRPVIFNDHNVFAGHR